MKKRHEPFIGITCDARPLKDRKRGAYYELFCEHHYPEAVKEAGGYPILLPITPHKSMIRKYLDEIDGVVIVGGDDVDPKLYGEKKKKGTGTIFAPRLHFERKLYAEARKRELPILGICYGMQLINVMEGGTLFQDIRRDAKSKMEHRHRSFPYHRIKIEKSSRLGKIIGKPSALVYSSHHQAVSRVAPRFKPVAFSSDGIIEAIECESERVFAVQWHPERNLAHKATQRLFKAFIQVCSRRGN